MQISVSQIFGLMTVRIRVTELELTSQKELEKVFHMPFSLEICFPAFFSPKGSFSTPFSYHCDGSMLYIILPQDLRHVPSWHISIVQFWLSIRRRQWQPTQYSCLENPMDGGAW